MTNEEARNRLKMPYNDNPRLYYEALDVAIKALEQINCLTGRPCEVCEFHSENGCSKWKCVFEEGTK